MRRLYTIICLVFSLATMSLSAQNDTTFVAEQDFEKAQLQEDLNYFVGVFRSVHPKPYWYTSSQEFDTAFMEFRTELPDSSTVTGFYSDLLPFVNAIGDENTRVFFPEEMLKEYIAEEGAFFPFRIQIINDEIFIKENLLPNSEIPQGAKISAINGQGAKRMIRKMNQLVPGAKESLRMAEITTDFSLLLWVAYQMDAPYEISVRLPGDGIIHTYNVEGVNAEKLGIFPGDEEVNHENDFDIAVDTDRDFATITIRDYQSHNDLKKFLPKAFSQVKSSKVENVLIDIRDLDVTDEGLADAVLRYVTKEPYRHYAAIEAKSSPITKEFYKGDYKAEMKAEKRVVRDKKAVKEAYKMVSKGLDYANTYYAPELKKPFGGGNAPEGEFFLLVNEGSKNSATVLAAIVQDHKLGLVIGKETGSRASRFKQLYYFTLPNTGLKCCVPHRYYLRPSSFDSGFGVLPDYTVEQDSDDLAKGVDTAIEFAADLFKKREGFREKRKAYEKRMKRN
ncbi:MAG: hypothetical protein C0593_03260 [Marinilabiliales bacterium]|nr:MAG: hypothetical protein C0593_03260 [Marinilabiliales bacterium]